MKSLFTSVLVMLLLCNINLSAQEEEKGYKFTDAKVIPVTSVKNQASSSTCWCFAAVGMMEAELLRMGKGEYNLSEMYIVRRALEDKADLYVRMHGAANFGPGGNAHDVTLLMKKYGAMPEELYTGLIYGDSLHKHSEIDAVLKAYLDAIIAQKTISPAWRVGFNALLDSYLGVVPEKFTYKGKEYTQKSFGESLGLNYADYIEITSFTHHPFYGSFALEIPDNWVHERVYNVPLAEMTTIINNSITDGYTVCWGADISDKGFSNKNGVAIVPDITAAENIGSDREKWEQMSSKERTDALYSFDGKAKEKKITQEERQKCFDSYETTDDHAMLLTGMATDANGNQYYMVKNSWGSTIGKFKNGYFYASIPFVERQTTSIMINKQILPKDVRKKLHLLD